MVRHAVALLVDHGCSTHETAERLNALGYRPRRAARWTQWSVRRLLLAPYLSGRWSYGSRARKNRSNDGAAIDLQIPAVLSEERHAQLLTALEATSITRGESRTYPLSTRLYGPCGNRFTGVWRKDRGTRTYRCNGDRWVEVLPEGQEKCGCRRLNAELVEQAVWGAVCDLLAQPERLVAMARDYLELRGSQILAERDVAESVEARLERLEAAIATAYAQGLKAGLAPKMLKAATQELEGERDALVRHQAQLETWRGENAAESRRMRNLWALADEAHTRLLGGMTPEEQAQVLALLQVRVTVLDWTECTTCLGRGSLPGGSGGLVCPSCRMMRNLPTVRIEGTVLDEVLLEQVEGGGDLSDAVLRGRVGEVTDVAGIPFRLLLGA